MVAGEAVGRLEALRRIAACRAARSEELDLGGLHLTTLDGVVLARETDSSPRAPLQLQSTRGQ